MKKLLIETNFGTFAAYHTPNDTITIYEGASDFAAATIEPKLKRKAEYDLSGEGMFQSVREWLETNHDRIEIERVTIHLVPTRL